MNEKRSVEHYKDHEIVCLVSTDARGWQYVISIVEHTGDNSAVLTEKSSEVYKTDTSALQAAVLRARKLVDNLTA